jgi:hypothetical protein
MRKIIPVCFLMIVFVGCTTAQAWDTGPAQAQTIEATPTLNNSPAPTITPSLTVTAGPDYVATVGAQQVEAIRITQTHEAAAWTAQADNNNLIILEATKQARQTDVPLTIAAMTGEAVVSGLKAGQLTAQAERPTQVMREATAAAQAEMAPIWETLKVAAGCSILIAFLMIVGAIAARIRPHPEVIYREPAQETVSSSKQTTKVEIVKRGPNSYSQETLHFDGLNKSDLDKIARLMRAGNRFSYRSLLSLGLGKYYEMVRDTLIKRGLLRAISKNDSDGYALTDDGIEYFNSWSFGDEPPPPLSGYPN